MEQLANAPAADAGEAADAVETTQLERPEGYPEKDTLKVYGEEQEDTWDNIKADAERYRASNKKLEHVKEEVEKAREAIKERDAVVEQMEKLDKSIQNSIKFASTSPDNFGEWLEYLAETTKNPKLIETGIDWLFQMAEEAQLPEDQKKQRLDQREFNKKKRVQEKWERERQAEAAAKEASEIDQHITTQMPLLLNHYGLPDRPNVRYEILAQTKLLYGKVANPLNEAAARVRKQMEKVGALETPKGKIQQGKKRVATRESTGRKDHRGPKQFGSIEDRLKEMGLGHIR